MTAHAMTMTELQNGRYLCECPTCGRRLVLDVDTLERRVLIEGDPYAVHNAGWLEMTATASSPDLEPFERWAEANL